MGGCGGDLACAPRAASEVVTIHQAAPPSPDARQRCTRCGCVLKDLRHFMEDGAEIPYLGNYRGEYPAGALIEVGPGYRGISLTALQPSCLL